VLEAIADRHEAGDMCVHRPRCASSEFCGGGRTLRLQESASQAHLRGADATLARLAAAISESPSIEDGLAEGDCQSGNALTRTWRPSVSTRLDYVFVTNPDNDSSSAAITD